MEIELMDKCMTSNTFFSLPTTLPLPSQYDEEDQSNLEELEFEMELYEHRDSVTSDEFDDFGFGDFWNSDNDNNDNWQELGLDGNIYTVNDYDDEGDELDVIFARKNLSVSS